MKLARRPFRRFFVIVIVFTVSIVLGGGAGMLAGYLRSAPALDEIVFVQDLTSYVYDIHGRQIAAVYRENRIPVSHDDIPKHLREAIVAIEDSRFYEHHGFDLRALTRALVADVRRMLGHGGFLQGGSTITQQLAKNAFLTHDRTWSRKLQELLWAIQIERKYSKSEILETYLNEIYLGPGIYGVEAAARYYFGKSVGELDLPEAALIAGLAQNVGLHSPFRDEEAARRRRNTVLMRMEELGYITRSQSEAARSSPIVVSDVRPVRNLAPDFVNHVIRRLLQLDGIDANTVYGGGLRIYTTLDLDLQMAAQRAVEEAFAAEGGVLQRLTRVDGNGLRQPQAALVALEPQTGHIRAMIGGRDGDEFNRATQAKRRPGSAMKIFVYTVAMQNGLSPSTVEVDEPYEWVNPATGETWEPKNFSRNFLGPITLRQALEQSINTVAAKLAAEESTRREVIELAQRMGITTFVTQGPRTDFGPAALALGGLTDGVHPIEMAQAYGVLANQGVRADPMAILRVESPDGRVLYEFDTKQSVVLSDVTSYIMTDMLRGVIERGTGRRANIGRPAAGKTGTSDDLNDLWFVGYTPDLVAAVWIGNDNPSSLELPGVSVGSGEAANIWNNFMRAAHADLPVRDFPKPGSGLVENVLVDAETGLLADESCFMIPASDLRREIFARGNEPTQMSPRCSNPFWNPVTSADEPGGVGAEARDGLPRGLPFRFDFDL